jgi:hypothetical protein
MLATTFTSANYIKLVAEKGGATGVRLRDWPVETKPVYLPEIGVRAVPYDFSN